MPCIESATLLFEQVSDESELLLPDNPTKTDPIRDLGQQHSGRRLVRMYRLLVWLNQSYILEKKDQDPVASKSEDIPQRHSYSPRT